MAESIARRPYLPQVNPVDDGGGGGGLVEVVAGGAAVVGRELPPPPPPLPWQPQADVTIGMARSAIARRSLIHRVLLFIAFATR